MLLVDDEREVRDIVGTAAAAGRFRRHASPSVARPVARCSGSPRSAGASCWWSTSGLPPESGSSFRAGLDVVRIASGLPAPPPVLLMSEAIDEKLMGRARRLGVSLLAFKPGLSKLDPLQYAADLRAFGDKLARDLLPRLAGSRGPGRTAPAPAPASATPAESRDRASPPPLPRSLPTRTPTSSPSCCCAPLAPVSCGRCSSSSRTTASSASPASAP